jgi:cysteine desulfurase/selenocysteine lyase
MPIDVQALDCDFLAFSGHKMYGPTGVGVLYGKKALLEAMPPYQTGGAMIDEVSFEKTTYAKLPYKFEAGTPNIAGVVGLGAAVNFIERIGFDFIQAHEAKLTQHLINKLGKIKGLKIIGNAKDRVAIASFVIDDVHAHDVATILDRQGIAVRAGHHCTMPLMQRFNLTATARVSLAVYNTLDEIDKLVEAIHSTQEVFQV